MADGLTGSEILKIGAEVRALRAAGAQICNLTVGDFDPAEFRIPRYLEDRIEEALRRGETNYPPSDGTMPLRQAVLAFYERWLGLRFPLESVLVTSGSRPGIYATFLTLVEPGDRVVYGVPSWNNNHYCYLAGAVGVPVVCGNDTAFLPTRGLLEGKVRGARLLVLNSPANPTGTAFSAETLASICDLVLEENARRGKHERPLYVLYDQVYWTLTFGDTAHVNPVSLRPEMGPYTLFVDGISKAFAATGVRVGWVIGPAEVIRPMSSLIGHIGAWAPRAEQAATAQLLNATEEVSTYLGDLRRGLRQRLDSLHDGLHDLRRAGLPVDSFSPMGAIYLSARFALNGMRTDDGVVLHTNEDIRRYLLRTAGLAIVPFQAFGAMQEDGWFRLSVGAVSLAEIERVLPRVRTAIESITSAV
ncbi:MAG: aminotransferase class I/II-fold pyridoxal phosphate-dependent enzyme [Anaerolineae bacterium]|nr:aminotransferase class I/II-fold pyridoxal phosphate-dependent enzyme [Gemmatimonadaceae bacterium]